MRQEIWAAHTWMQTVSAYPNGPLAPPQCHFDRVRALGIGPTYARLLHIGPGTFSEVKAVRDVFAPTSHTVMTLSADEVGPIREAGFECELGDMHDAPFENGAFDLIFSNNVLEHAIAPHMALLEHRRMLAPNGHFYAIVPTFETPGGAYTPWHVYCFNEPTWRELFRKAGFSIDRFLTVAETLPGGGKESYYHIRAQAVEPPTPHDEILRRISELKR